MRPELFQNNSGAMSSTGKSSATGKIQPRGQSIRRLRPAHELLGLHADARSFAEYCEVFAQIESLAQLRGALLSFEDAGDRRRAITTSPPARSHPCACGQSTAARTDCRARTDRDRRRTRDADRRSACRVALSAPTILDASDAGAIVSGGALARERAHVARGSDRSPRAGRVPPARATNSRPTMRRDGKDRERDADVGDARRVRSSRATCASRSCKRRPYSAAVQELARK